MVELDRPDQHPGEERLPGSPTPGPDRARAVAAAFLLSPRTDNTRRSYTRDLRAFFTWCAQHDLDPLAVARVHLDAYRRHLEQAPPGHRATRRGIEHRPRALVR